MSKHTRTNRQRWARLAAAVSVPPLLATTLAFGGVLPTNPANAQLAPTVAECITQGEVYFNSGGETRTIKVYNQSGTLLREFPTARRYTDIAMTPEGRLYGIIPDTHPRIDELNPQTGELISSMVTTGPSAGFANALSPINNTSLYTGGQGVRDVYTVDLTTGSITPSGFMFPEGVASSGDFFQLDETHLLALGTDGRLADPSALYILGNDGSSEVLGRINNALFGGARIGNTLYLGIWDGQTVMIPDYTSIVPSNNVLATQPFATYGALVWGATSSAETIYCPVVNPFDVAGDQGQPVNLTPPYALGMDPASAEFTRADIPAGATLSADGKTLTVPGEGVWQIQPDGTFVFTPEAGLLGSPTPVKYSANSADGAVSAIPADLTVTYPDVDDVSGAGNEGQPVTVPPALAEGTDPTTVQLIDPATNTATDGNVVVPGEGTWSVDQTTGDITFTPEAGFNADPTPITYTAAVAGHPDATAIPATVTITYADVPDLTGSGDQGQPVTTPSQLNPDMDPTSVQLIDPATNQPTAGDLVVPGEGTWSVNPTSGDITFTPEAGFQGDPTPITYTAQSNSGGVATPATVTVTYPDVADVSGAGDQGQPVNVPFDIDDQVIPSTVTMVDADGNPVDALVVPGEGTWTVNPSNGSIVFTPEDGFNGVPTPQRYTGNDADGNQAIPATVTVTYPDVSDISGAGNEGSPVTMPADLGEGTDPTTVQLIDPATNQPTDGDLVVPGEGTWSVNPTTGAITFTPEASFNADPTPITYTAALEGNPDATATPATVTVTYSDVPDLTGAGDQGQPVTIPAQLEDRMDPSTVELIDPATNQPTDGDLVVPGEGTWSVDPTTGDITFTPEAGFTEDPTPITYTATSDTGSVAVPATVTVTYPDVSDVTGSGSQGEPITVPSELGDTIDPTTVTMVDADGNPVDALVVPGEGTWTTDDQGNLIFTPEPGFNSTPTQQQYTGSDADGNQAIPATVSVVVPDVSDVSGVGDEGAPVVVPGDFGPGVDPATVQLIDPTTGQPSDNPVVVPGEGTWTTDDQGNLIFTPEPGFNGTPTPQQYTAALEGNPDDLAEPATVTVTYPDVVDLSGSGDQGTPVTVPNQLGDTMDPATVQLIDPATGQPTDNPVIVPGEGTWTVEPNGDITFTPQEGFEGTPTPQRYTAQTTEGGQAIPATVTVDYPDVVDINGSGPEGEPITVPSQLGDTMDPATVQLIDPATGQPTDNPVVVPGEGTWTVEPNGDITFTPEASFEGAPTPQQYTAQDTEGNQAVPANVSVNSPFVDDVSGTGPQGTPVTVPADLSDNIDPSTVQLIDPTTGEPTDGPVEVPGEGTWTVDDQGNITFTPEAGFQGDPTPIRYTGTDADGNPAIPATVTVLYPDVMDNTGSGPQGTPVTVPPAIDGQVDPTTIELIDPVTGEPTTDPVVVPGEGTWTVDPNNGNMTFTPEPGFQGDPTPIQYIGSDQDGNPSEPATVTVTYPDVVDVTGSGPQGEPITVTPPLAEGMDPTTVELIDPVTGQPTTEPVVVPGEGTWTVEPNGGITFTPEEGFDDQPTPIDYTADDLNGNPAIPATVTITTPNVEDVTGTGPQGTPVTVPTDLSDNIDPSTVQLIDPTTGEPTDGPVEVPGEGTWTVDDQGNITFTPEDGFQGDPTPIRYTGTDTNGNPAIPATVTVDYPDVSDVSGSGPQGEPATVPPSLDEDADPSTVQIIDPSTGEPTTDPVVVPGEGTWTVDPNNGNITFTPEAGFDGDPTPVEYIAEDGNGNPSEPATVTVTYPDVPDITGSGDQGTPVTVTPDLDENMDPTTVELIDPATGEPTTDPVVVPGEGTWTVTPEGGITFTPEEDFDGDPTPIEYTADDLNGNPAEPGTVTITYPDIPDASGSGDQGTPVTVTPELPGDIDPGTLELIDPVTGEPTKDPVVVPGEGTWSLEPDGGITFTPEADFDENPTPIQYTGTDTNGNTPEPGTITVTYPDVEDVTGTGTPGQPVSVPPILGPGVDPGTVQIVDPGTGAPTDNPVVVPGEGTWTVDEDGNIVFTPEPGFEGDPTPIKYVGEDEDGNVSIPATVTITYPVDPNPGGGPSGPGNPNPGGPNPGDPNPGDPNPGDPNPGDPNPGDPNPGDPNPGDPNPGDPYPGNPNPGTVPGNPITPNPYGAINTGAPEAAQGVNPGLVAGGGAAALLSLFGLGWLAKRRREEG